MTAIRSRLGAVALATLLLTGCSHPTSWAGDRETRAGSPLVGTWRLTEFQSMDDAIGTRTPEADQTYSMTLNADGSATFVLNCNRGSGSYVGTPSTASSGRLEFGRLAITQALCPPPSLDERFARDLEFVRSYLLKDGRLYLSLMADGGIYRFEPDASAGPASQD